MGSRISIKFGKPYRIALILLLNKLYKVDIRCICLDQIVIIHIFYPAVFQPIIWMVLCEDTFKECTKHIYVHNQAGLYLGPPSPKLRFMVGDKKKSIEIIATLV